MTRFKLNVAVAMVCCAFTVVAVKTQGADPDEQRIQHLRAAVPKQPAAAPQKKRRLLVFTLTHGFRHSSIETGVKALEIMGQQTGGWETVASQDANALQEENLKQFDGICFLSTTGDIFLPGNYGQLQGEEKRQALEIGQQRNDALLRFVSQGKGFIGIHAATDTNYNWRGYGEMIGGYFDGHPWGAGDEVSIGVQDSEHPLTRHFKGENLALKEEIYQMREPYSRQNQRVLLGLDLKQTKFKPGMKRTDNDYPVSWVKSYRKGRVFYSSLGHREEIYTNPQVLQHFLAGIQFALGDLAATTAPLPLPTN